MNILITRPLIDAEDLMAKLFSLGHKIIHLPTLKISPAKVQPINEKDYDAFIFTSANAIRNLKAVTQNKDKPCYCVGAITEKIVRLSGYTNTISAGGTVNALKNIIINSEIVNVKSKLAYFCGDNISFHLDTELKKEGYHVEKIVNYISEKIVDLNEENKKIISSNPPNIIFVYSTRSAESLVEIFSKYSLLPLMTGSKVMCISNKVLEFLKNKGWKNLEIFNPGEELLKLE